MTALDLAIIVAVFVDGLATNLTLNKRVRKVIGFAGVILIVVFIARYFTAFTTSDKMQQGLLFSQLLMIAAFSSRILTRAYLKRQAGPLIVQLPVSGLYVLLGFLSAALLVLLLLQGVLSVIIGSNFFNPLQSPSVVLPLYVIFGLLMISVFEKTEIRELGIIKYGVFQNWSDFKSYAWNTPTTQNSEVELTLQPRLASFLVRSIKLEMPLKYQEAVAMLLAKYQ